MPEALPAPSRPRRLADLSRVIGAAAAMYVLFFVYLTDGLNLDMMVSDVLSYWQKSFEMAAPYDLWWPPGYPLLLALARVLTFNLLPPIVVMCLVSGAFYLLAVRIVYGIASERGWERPSRIALLFAAYPFVGLGASVYPIADSAAIALLLMALLAFERRAWWRFCVFAAAALMVHKATWFIVPLLTLAAFIRHRDSRALLPLSYVPLVLWIVLGASYHGDPIWFLRWGVEHLIVSKSSMPIGDGIIGPFLSGSLAKMIKGMIVLSVLGLAILSCVWSVRAGDRAGVCVSCAMVVMTLVVNEYEIWVVPRFSRVLIVPLGAILSKSPLGPAVLAGRGFAASLALCLATNLMYGYYLTRFFAR